MVILELRYFVLKEVEVFFCFLLFVWITTYGATTAEARIWPFGIPVNFLRGKNVCLFLYVSFLAYFNSHVTWVLSTLFQIRLILKEKIVITSFPSEKNG